MYCDIPRIYTVPVPSAHKKKEGKRREIHSRGDRRDTPSSDDGAKRQGALHVTDAFLVWSDMQSSRKKTTHTVIASLRAPRRLGTDKDFKFLINGCPITHIPFVKIPEFLFAYTGITRTLIP